MRGNRSCFWNAHSVSLRLSHSRRAFTLFEMILVLALLVVLGAALYPSLEAMYGDSKVTAGGDMVRAAWAEAQSHAMNEGRFYRFAVQPYAGNYRVAPDISDFWKGGSGADDGAGPGGKAMVLEGILPKGVRFEAPETWTTGADPNTDTAVPAGSSDSGSWTTVVVFKPDGTASDDRAITLTARGARPLALRIRGLTGVITVKTVEGK
jgi:prepilin-type N-terminal cleavage/methylation domain-containing protein